LRYPARLFVCHWHDNPKMPEANHHDTIRAVAYVDGVLRLLDQRRLPLEETYIDCRDAAEVAGAIRDLVVRGAPAIGIAAAWGIVLEAKRLAAAGVAVSASALEPAMQQLNAARPTAVNLAETSSRRWQPRHERSRTKISRPTATWANWAPVCSAAASACLPTAIPVHLRRRGSARP
jgi:methylthioribose-1-phosphate isomerase